MMRLALPALAEESLVLMVTWTDWWLTGHFFRISGDATKAAMNLMGYTMWLIPSMFAAIAIGATAVIARHIGAGDYSLARRAVNQAFLIGLGFATLITMLGLAGGNMFIDVMQLKDDAAQFARSYLYIIIPFIPFVMFAQVGAACLRGAGDTVTGFVAKSAVVLVNILVSTSLVTGWGFFPSIGWNGLAIGTACGYAVGGTIISVALLRGRAGLRLNLLALTPDIGIISRLFRIGVPGGIDIGAMLFSQLLFIALINKLGKSAAAAHGLAVQIEASCFLPGAAFQVAAATLAGQFLGARLPRRATRSVVLSLIMGGTIMCAMGSLIFVCGQQFATFFTGDAGDPTTAEAGRLLRIVAMAMPALAVVMILSGALRGAGDTRWPLFFTLIGFLLIRIPLAIFLAFDSLTVPVLGIEINGLGWGVVGAWYAMAIDLVIRAILVGGRFASNRWHHIEF